MTLHYDINGDDFSAAGEASSAVKKVLAQLSVNPVVIRRVAIAMYEAEINTVIHGNGGYADVEISPKKIVVVFKDNGPGIPNMKKYTDELDIQSTVGVGTTVTMTVNIN